MADDPVFSGPYQPRYAFSANGEGTEVPYRAWRRNNRHVEHSSRHATASVGTVARRPVKVGVVLPWLGMGGVERWLAGLAAHSPGIQWTGLALTENPNFYDERCSREIARHMPIFGGPVWKPYRQALATPQAAVIAATAEAEVVLFWVGDLKTFRPLLGNRPTVLVSHGACRWTKKLLSSLSPHATHYVGVSEAAASTFPTNLQDRVEVIWNGVEVDRLAPTRFHGEVRREWGVGEDDLVVAYVGRFSREKNLLAIAKAVQGLGPEAVAVYIGSGPNEPEFRRQAVAITEGRVRFVDPPEHIGDAYMAIDCLLMAGESEGFGLAIAEAWMSFVPVVATSTGIIPELESVHGRLTHAINHDDGPAALADAVRQAVAQEREALSRCTIAREVVWEYLTASAMGRRWSDYLFDLVQGRVPGRVSR